MYYVYALIDPITNLPFYVGKGKTSNNRHKDHLSDRRGKENRLRWKHICDLRKSGLEPRVDILLENIQDEREAYDQESEFIRQYGKIIDGTGILTNIVDDARPPSWKGRIKSKEHRENLSKSHLGKKLSPETIQKISDTKKANGTYGISGMAGKNHNQENKEKLRLARLGSTMSLDSSAKKSASLHGKPWSDARKIASLNQKKTGPIKGQPWSEARRLAQQMKRTHDDNS